MADEPDGLDEVQHLSARIQRTEMARALIEAGKYDQALALLQRIRDSYDPQTEPDKRRYVEWMLNEVRNRRGWWS